MEKLPIGASGQIKTYYDDIGNIVIEIDPTFAGQVSINTVGTIQIGDWQANVISPQFGGTGCDNKNAYLQLAGETTITGPLILHCADNENTELVLPKKGTVALQQESLQISNCFSELNAQQTEQAFNNISPNTKHGDITYLDGINNVALNIGENNSYLKVLNNKLCWSQLPKYLKYIIHQNETTVYENETLNFLGQGFILSQTPQSWKNFFITNIALEDKIESLTKIKSGGFLVYVQESNDIQTRELLCGQGIKISYPNGKENNPTISLDNNYCGHTNTTVVGTIKEGSWKGEIISPQFGGTGCQNNFTIELNGNFKTSCNVSFIAGNNKNKPSVQHSEIVLYSNADNVLLELPTKGKLSTVQESLQSCNNLLDVNNPKEAFRHISPTQNRGDLIVRGYGDYDINVPIGEDGQILIVNKTKPSFVEWKDLNLEDTIENIINSILEQKELEKQSHKQKDKDNQNSQLYQFVNVIMMQLDYMCKTGQMKAIKELKQSLNEWSQSIFKKN